MKLILTAAALAVAAAGPGFAQHKPPTGDAAETARAPYEIRTFGVFR